jgi:protocatechuate 3,4-dioxygenase alpha subunit
VTRIYFSGDPANESDSVLALAPENRRDTLMARRDATDLALWTFEVYLCGERETVFFDI